MDAKSLLKKVAKKGKSYKGRIGLYVDTELYKEVQELCDKEDITTSELIEELMRDFMASMKVDPKKDKK